MTALKVDAAVYLAHEPALRCLLSGHSRLGFGLPDKRISRCLLLPRQPTARLAARMASPGDGKSSIASEGWLSAGVQRLPGP
jgi:hypothetical protein